MKNLGRIVVIGAALLMPTQLEAQPRNGTRSGVHVELSFGNGPAGRSYARHCRPGRRGNRFNCRIPRRGYVAYNLNRRDRRWVQAEWGDIHLYSPDTRYGSVRLGERGLREILDRRTLSRVRRVGRRAGLRGPITGRWSEHRRSGAVLEMRMQGRPLVEVHDYDGDGYVDDVFVARFLRY